MKKIENKGINVLSLFDGISCAYLALKKAGVKVNKYYSSEIDPAALKIQQHHYSDDPAFIPIGDVREIDGTKFTDVDLIIGGSPCQNLSSLNATNRTGLEGEKSSLFYEAARIVREIYAFQPASKHLYILFENVQSMTKKDKFIITDQLSFAINEKIKPIAINSSIIAPAHRRRYYWTNIKGIEPIKPNDIRFQDILECGYTDKDKANVILSTNVTLTNGIYRHHKMSIGNIIYKDKEFAELPVSGKLIAYPFFLHESGYSGKSGCVLNEYDYPNNCYRLPSVIEYSRMMQLPDNYVHDVPNVSKSDKIKCIGLGFTVDVIAHLLKPLADMSSQIPRNVSLQNKL